MDLTRNNLKLWFPEFEEPLLDILISKGIPVSFQQGESVIEAGQPMNGTLLITKGSLKLFTEGDEGEEFFMYYLEPGDACALSFVCSEKDKKSYIDAIAHEETEALAIPKDLMDELMMNHKTWYYFVVNTYRKRYRELLDVIQSIAFKSMDERLEYYLIKQKIMFKSNKLSITHEQIASDLNSSRVVISRLLKQMEVKGLLQLSRNSIELK